MKNIIDFNETRIKEKIERDYSLTKSIKAAFTYLEGKLHTNNITKGAKFREGKNYDYYLFKDGAVSIIVRCYNSSHFTFYVRYRPEDFKKDELTVFTVGFDTDKMSDADWDIDRIDRLKEMLPQLVALCKSDDIGSVWNSYCFIVPKYADVEMCFSNKSVDNLDLLLFACEELFRLYTEIFAETDVLEAIKLMKVGDKFGSCREITNISSEVKDGYYHGAGISTKRIDEFGMKHEGDRETWSDVYSLAMFYYDSLFPDNR